ncbi:30S ribosomal protein S20 [Candidatus Riesia sp. GBBU]|nr:30S ribosomal protein S20 [Candidatus Riesia sp. GBBU]ARC55068.1 30S ribosomal protein S20 [Candidatus Riesia sp. GBBU]
MTNIKSSRKRIIQSEKKRKINSSKKSRIKTILRKLNRSILKDDKKSVKFLFVKMQSILDKYSREGLIHVNKSSRFKSKISSKIKSMK